MVILNWKQAKPCDRCYSSSDITYWKQAKPCDRCYGSSDITYQDAMTSGFFCDLHFVIYILWTSFSDLHLVIYIKWGEFVLPLTSSSSLRDCLATIADGTLFLLEACIVCNIGTSPSIQILIDILYRILERGTDSLSFFIVSVEQFGEQTTAKNTLNTIIGWKLQF